MRSYALLLALVGFVVGAGAIALFRGASDITINVDVAGQAVANLALMHQQQMATMEALASAIVSAIFLAAAGIAATIER